jgi:hypothetical protein
MMVAIIDRTRYSPQHRRMMRMIRQVDVEPIEFVKDFLQRRGVGREQLADLLDLSLPQVERWFFDSSAKNFREPEEKHIKRLKEIDFVLDTLAWAETNIDRCPPHLRTLYLRVKNQSRN